MGQIGKEREVISVPLPVRRVREEPIRAPSRPAPEVLPQEPVKEPVKEPAPEPERETAGS